MGSATRHDATYSLQVQTTAMGAGIEAVTLNEFPPQPLPPDRARSRDDIDHPYVFQQPSDGLVSMATQWVRVNGKQVKLSDVAWTLEESTATSAKYVVTVGGEKPLVRVHKTIQIEPKSGRQAGYEVLVRHSVENVGAAQAQVELGIGGPRLPPREIETGADRYLVAGYNDNPSFPTPGIKMEAHAVEQLKDDKATLEIAKSEKGWPVIWAGLISTYFDAIVYPVPWQQTNGTAQFIEGVTATTRDAANPTAQTVELVFKTKGLVLASEGQKADVEMLAYFGPKERATLKNGYYDVWPRAYNNTLTAAGSCFCTIPFLVDGMVWLLRGFHAVLRDWGLAIIALVLVVRAALHPLTRKSTESMARMQKLAPEMERIKKKYEHDQAEMQRAMLAFQKEYAPGMMLGCLPMVIQMPIWVALWSALQSTFELRLSPFLWGHTWIHDLAKPDRLLYFPDHRIEFLFFKIDAINVLPLALAVVYWIQFKFQPQQVATTPEQQQQQKMMQWMMPIMLPLMFYSGPSGLMLYMLASTILAILETRYIKQKIKAREAAEAAQGPVIIDVTPTRASRRRDEAEQPKKAKGGIAGFFEKLQKFAEDAQRQAEERKKRK
jgi:YidC/Oxa1 family membrane protein insertase